MEGKADLAQFYDGVIWDGSGFGGFVTMDMSVTFFLRLPLDDVR
jgi:hypothetical protein